MDQNEDIMTINLDMPEIRELKPKITVFGVGGAGGNAVNNMIRSGLLGCDFVVANTDSQALTTSSAERLIQMGVAVTEGLGAGSQPEIGRAAAEEAIDEINDHLGGSHMVFVTAGMGGGTGTGAAPVIARHARDQGILTVGVVTKPFQFEGQRRMRVAESGIEALQDCVDTLIVIPNQNLFRVANEKTTFADAFAMADQVLYSGVACITDLMVKEGLINLDFADVRSVMREMGKAMMGTGESSGDRRATQAAEAAIANPLLDETSMKGARGLLISITGGKDLTLFEVDEAATRIREEVDPDANIILGATFEESLEGVIRVSVVATGIENEARSIQPGEEQRIAEMGERLRQAAEQHKAASEPAAQPAAPAAIASTPAPKPTPAPAQPTEAPAATPAPAAAHTIAEPPPAPPASEPRPAMTEAPRPAAVAAADPAITIQPLARQPLQHAPVDEPLETPRAQPEPTPADKAFVPPAVEAPAPRVPRVEDFPPMIQRQMSAQGDEGRDGEDGERGPLGLLRRLATVGLGRREEEPLGGHAQQPARRPAPRPAAEAQAAPSQPAPRRQPQRVEERGALDDHGRAPARSQRPLDDELEIPAFLRRQAN